MARTRKLVKALQRRGPHRVLRGDLAFAGLPGVVYTPEAGQDLPAIAFGHDWLTSAARYSGLLEHLASWGIVAGAPDTQRGLAPSALTMASDLGGALDILAGARLGVGDISVHPAKLGVVGHGFGGSAAVFAAAGMSGPSGRSVQSVAAVFPTVVSPAAEQPAATLTVPGLILTAPGDPTKLNSSALALSRVWPTATLRMVSKAEPGGMIEGRRLAKVVGLPGAHRYTQRSVRALLAGYLLATLDANESYREFADPDVKLTGTEWVDDEAATLSAEQKIVALLK